LSRKVPRSPDEQFAELLRVARRVDTEIATLRHYSEMFNDFRLKVLIDPDQHALRTGHFFISAMFEWYTQSQLVALRALTDRRADQWTLTGLFERIKKTSPERITHPPTQVEVQVVLSEIADERKVLHAHVGKRIAHRDPDAYSAPAMTNADAFLARVDEWMDLAWTWIYGENRGRVLVDRDPYWIELLFAARWLPPTEHSSRRSAGSEARYVSEEERHDYTATTVYGRRPTDGWLRKAGMTRSEFERFREDD
jgi:hypothetical protein